MPNVLLSAVLFCAVTVNVTRLVKSTICPWVKSAVPIFMTGLPVVMIFTFTAVMAEAIVRGALAKIAVPLTGTATMKFSSPKAIAVSVLVTVSVVVWITPLPSAAAAVIVVAPIATPVAIPVEASIVALSGLELVHVIAFEASLGVTATVSVIFSPMPTEGLAGMIVMEVALIMMLTVIVPFTLLPSAAAAVMTVLPKATPVTSPEVASTVALSGLELDHVTV